MTVIQFPKPKRPMTRTPEGRYKIDWLSLAVWLTALILTGLFWWGVYIGVSWLLTS